MNTTADITGANVAIGGSVRLVNATGQSATITALPSGTYNTGISGGSAIVFHRISDGGGGSDEIAFETHHQGTRHGEAARFNKSGNLVFPNGQGIDFSATTDVATVSSELLDDYEEGTWTPVLNGTTSNMGTGVGKYAKVGSITHYWIEFGHIAAGNGSFSANAYITGFPYSTPNHPPNHWTGTSSYMNSAYGMTLMTNYYNSADQFYITQAAGSLRYLWCQVSVCNF